MKTTPENIAIDSVELPAFVLEALAAAEPAARPRVEVVFDARTRLVLGFRVGGGQRPAPRRRGSRQPN